MGKIGIVIGLFSVSVWSFADPMAPPGYSASPIGDAKVEPTPPVYVLNQIMVGEKRQTAVINGEVVVEGETLLSARIVKILTDRVEISINGKREILTIAPEYPDIRH